MDEQERASHAGSGLITELQDAVLPKGLPLPQRVEVAAHYLLAEDDARAGGDWFDVVPLADGRVVIVVGDVVGNGVGASVVMAELKVLFEERVRVDGDLGAALQLLDERAGRVVEARSTTLCACILDTTTGELTYCTAGHPPPILVTADGDGTYLPASGAGPLRSGLGFPTAQARLAEGDLLLLYSDGLVERPGRSASRSTVELLRVAEETVRAVAAPGQPVVDQVSRRVLELLPRISGYADDITLLALQVVPQVAPLRLRLPAIPDAVRTVRADVGDWLGALRIGALDRTAVQHAMGELVSNVVQHAYAEVDVSNPVEVTIGLAPDGTVELCVADEGRWRPATETTGGRGLAIVAGFLDEFTLEQDDTGTRACGRYRVTHPATLLRGTSTGPRQPQVAPFDLVIEDDVLRVAGELDVRDSEHLRHACARASRGGTRAVTVDLTDVDLLCSAAVQAIYDARSAGPVSLLAPMGSPAQHVLDLVRLSHDG